jgi:hypothetical protein
VFEAALQRYRQVMDWYLMAGDADYLIHIVSGSALALQRLINDEFSKIPGDTNSRARFVLKQVKYKIALPGPSRRHESLGGGLGEFVSRRGNAGRQLGARLYAVIYFGLAS